MVAGAGYVLVAIAALMLPETNGLDLRQLQEGDSTAAPLPADAATAAAVQDR